MMTANVTRPPRHKRVVKDARKPTVLHIEQKYRSPPSHRSLGGKSRQYGSSSVEQLLCRPMCLSTVSPVAEVTEYVTQFGSQMGTAIMTVAVAR
jgi:hypothetical protein